MTRGHAEDTKRHANSLPSTEARGRRHAARGADRDPHFFDRHPGRRRAAGGQHQERHRREASHRGGVPRQQPAVADVDRRGQHRVVCLPGKRRRSDPADRLGGPGQCPPACRGCAADRDHHRRERDRRHGDHPGALAAAGGAVARAAAAQLHRRRFGLYKLTMRRLPARRLAPGFSMVELMVAMVISLIGVIIIFQVFETFEGVRRTSTSGGDAQQNGAVALYFMERDLRNAGMGINDTIYAGCNMIGSDSSRTTPNFPPLGNPMILAPAFITAGVDAQTPDQLAVFYGSQNQIANSTTLVANMILPTSPLTVQSRFAFRPGDLVLLVEPGSGKNCAFMEVTSLPAAPSNQINHDPGTYTLAAGLVSVSARFNPAAGTGVTYGGANTASVARVFNLGNLHDDLNFPASQNVTLPVYNLYSIAANNTLTVSNAFVISGGEPAVNSVADNIVHMRADYGVDDGPANDGILDRYISATPNWSQVIALRIALVARSALAEKPAGGGATCNTTTVPPTWSGDTGGARSFDLSADPDWKCYRYRMFETTVPLRNWIWKSS